MPWPFLLRVELHAVNKSPAPAGGCVDKHYNTRQLSIAQHGDSSAHKYSTLKPACRKSLETLRTSFWLKIRFLAYAAGLRSVMHFKLIALMGLISLLPTVLAHAAAPDLANEAYALHLNDDGVVDLSSGSLIAQQFQPAFTVL